MKLKPLLLVVAGLGAVSALVYWRQRTPVADATVDPRVGQELLAADALKSARSLAITGGDKQTVTVVADEKGERWTVNEYHGLPADFDKLMSTFESLRTAKVDRAIGSAAAQERLGFAGEKIELKDAAGKVLAILNLGKTADNGGRFIRYGDEKKSYLVDFNAWIDATPKNWAAAQLLKLKPEDVAAVDVKFADGTGVAAKRTEDGKAWTGADLPAGKEIKGSAVDSLLSQLTGLRFSETTATDEADAVAAKAHTTTATLTLKNGTSYTVALGRRPAPPPAPAPAAPPAAPTAGPVSATTPPVGIDGKTGEILTPALPPAVAAPAAPAAPATPSTPAAPPPPPPPPGPVYAFVASNRVEEPINALMQKRAFQVGEWIYTSLPANRDALLQDKPAPAPTPSAAPAATAPAPATPTPVPTPAPAP